MDVKQEDQEDSDQNEVSEQSEEHSVKADTESEVVTTETTEITIKKTVKTTIRKTQTTLESFVGIQVKSDKSDPDGGSPVSTKSGKEKKLKLKETMLFDELTPEQANKEGYLLWEFRPMDNSFMEEWGTFDKVPRYKWEKPTIMDPDVAVDPEYARRVLAGEIPHRWSKHSEPEQATE